MGFHAHTISCAAPYLCWLGAASVLYTGDSINILYLILIIIGAVLSHISVNALNEYDDFKTGLDFKTIQTPFSRGSKALPENPEKAHYALITGIASLIITTITGFYFIYISGWGLLPLGLLGMLIIVTYTKWIKRNTLLCLIVPA
ncbi:MAG: UbiA family prenyltransferase [Desulfobacteraceae bacterium]|nr:UbiA family prenyltransferase [Desulfobacteraceae bacterium]